MKQEIKVSDLEDDRMYIYHYNGNFMYLNGYFIKNYYALDTTVIVEPKAKLSEKDIALEEDITTS
jgi:hypothetical protein